MSNILRFFDLSVVMESDVVPLVGKSSKTIMISVLGDFKNTPFSSLPNFKMAILADLEELAIVTDVLQLNVLGLISLVETVNLPSSGFSVATGGGDLASVELQVLA
eukprot:CAMPEP_0201474808 /NCGR_PEP_ID=MMETSP0151_2-20130828/261_1 /ASSEMBLY_ACC=CAM_ASM_000257 /TAXON_ID=200890 /ORGANISM="Paramoeba atlantica, Strain 621/1 / CCAP 1560/9" /LENGTH=105 /DNA_ID=CAMNT_0047854709 /DNA_START=68 /DNA_END=385 /DNA_ORIENTATION=+